MQEILLLTCAADATILHIKRGNHGNTDFRHIKLIKRLKEAGFSEPQAEAIADAFKAVQEASVQDLVTKQDLKAELRELEIRIIKWVIAISAGQAALIIALHKLIRWRQEHS